MGGNYLWAARLVALRRGCGGGRVGGEDAAEVGREGARLVGVGLAAQRVLEIPHAAGEVVALATEIGRVVGEVAVAVLLAQGPHAHHEDARHQEQLHEPILPLRRVRQQPERAPPPDAAVDVRHPLP
jgi:hypothetical protein